ncbi:MAG: hypothetical protein Q4C13_02585, partial [Clostridia bacterium]|nr:hypothetical protein [Clostridia bacterium]
MSSRSRVRVTPLGYIVLSIIILVMLVGIYFIIWSMRNSDGAEGPDSSPLAELPTPTPSLAPLESGGTPTPSLAPAGTTSATPTITPAASTPTPASTPTIDSNSTTVRTPTPSEVNN